MHPHIITTPKDTRPALVNISQSAWHPGRLKRNLSIFTELAKTGQFSRAFYVNTTIVDHRGRPTVEQIAHCTIGECPVTVLQPHGALPLAYRSVLSSRVSGYFIAAQIRKLVNGSRFSLWLNTISPVECGLAEVLSMWADRVVFDSSDDLPMLELPHMREDAERRLARMVRRAGTVLCVNSTVAGRIDHTEKTVFRNGASFESLTNPAPLTLYPWLPKPAGAKYVGFLGSLHEERVDAGLLQYLLNRFPAYQFLFVGWVSESLKPLLNAHSNAHIVQEVSADVLGSVIRSFDASIVPHADNRHTRGNDLLKVLDCNACGVPVVSTRVSGMNEGEYVARIADTHSEFGDAVGACIDGSHGLDLTRGIAMARERSWAQSVPTLLPLLSPVPRRQTMARPVPAVAR